MLTFQTLLTDLMNGVRKIRAEMSYFFICKCKQSVDKRCQVWYNRVNPKKGILKRRESNEMGRCGNNVQSC